MQRMYDEMHSLVVVGTIVFLVGAGFSCLFFPPIIVFAFAGITILLLWMLLLGARKRIVGGTFGLSGREKRVLDEWLEENGGKKEEGMHLPG